MKSVKELEKALARGEVDDLSDHVNQRAGMVVVDWKDRGSLIEEFANCLKGNLVGIEEDDEITIEYGDRSVTADTSDDDTAQLKILLALAKLLAPEHEFRVERSTLEDDTQVYLLQPRIWWERMDKSHPKIMKKIFRKVNSRLFG